MRRLMHILKGIADVPSEARGATLAIGNFDGMHRGHQALLQVAKDNACRIGGLAGAIVFEPHPREFFQPDKPLFRLTPLDCKLQLMEAFGLDVCVVLAFDAKLAGLSAQDFIGSILVDALGVRHVVIGYDFHFGNKRSGSPETMQAAGVAHGFGVTVVSQVAEAGEVFSSNAIRAELAQGDVQGAARMLGRWWRVAGTVTGGAKRGTGLGFPTANIALSPEAALAHGIYAVRVHLDGTIHDGAAYLGTRPTFDDGAPVLEVFLLNFEGDLYGRRIEVEFIDHLRGDLRFGDVEALTTQMSKDCERAAQVLRRAPAEPL